MGELIRKVIKKFSFVLVPWRKFRALGWKKQTALVSGLLLIFLIITPLLTYAWFARDIADKERLMNRSNTGLTILDRNDEEIYKFGKSNNDNNATLDDIADVAEQALISSEDKTFYEHSGVSFRGIAGAAVANLLNKDLTKYGGSTLTQQLVKNNLLTSSKSILRKYQEFSIALAIERQYSKDEILEMYLNSVYYGEGAFGIKEAAQTYFDKTPAELTLAESSFLIGILPAPSAYSPYVTEPNLEGIERQQNRVLTRMVEDGIITEAEKEAALTTELAFSTQNVTEQKHAHHFTQMVIADLNKTYGEETVARSGFKIKTTLDLNWQKQAEATISSRMPAIRSMGGTNAALVAVDPKTGEIKALVGSSDWNNEQFGKVNMATSPRQPGSSFKPIYYTEAIDKRLITAATIMKDRKKTYPGGYEPQNFDRRFRGDVTIRDALATSLNIPSLDVIEKVGVENATKTAQRMGISTVNEPEKYGLALALGTAETRLTEMTNAYAAFANQGVQFERASVLRIDNKYNKKVYEYRPKGKRVQSSEASYIISSILSDNSARAPLFGNSLSVGNQKVAVKTGTTDDNKDAWAIGYNPNVTVGVWVGNNDNTPMNAGGASAAGPIWRSAIQSYIGRGTPIDFPRPSAVVTANICQLNRNYQEFFIRGTVPSNTCSPKPVEEEPKKEEEPVEEPRQPSPPVTDDDDDDDETEEEPAEPTPTPTPAPSPTPTPTPTPTQPSSGGTTTTPQTTPSQQ